MTNSDYLHIVCFDIPFPVTHGGFFDLYYKIKALHHQGIKIILHCFQHRRSRQDHHLNQYCHRVHYYDRRVGFNGFSFILPYIVSSRKSNRLLANLSSDNFPILLEGTHCTYPLFKNSFPNRRIIYRLHNIEHIYYRQLFLTEGSLFKKLYYGWESLLLKWYEKKTAPAASAVLAVSPADKKRFQQYCPGARTDYFPVFLPQADGKGKPGKGNYCLYHGNLSIAENETACRFLVQKVFEGLPFRLLIAGRAPSAGLQHLIRRYKNVQLIADPSDDEMRSLIQEAHINLVVSMNATGIKLKLINALLYGRHCIGNKAAIEDTGLESCCTIADTPGQIIKAVTSLMQVPYTQEDVEKRTALLQAQFDNEANAKKLIKLLY